MTDGRTHWDGCWREHLECALALVERLKMEAQVHAQEARTQRATVAECYRAATGGTGEPGSWHGAEPVRQRIAALEAELAEARKDTERLREAAGNLYEVLCEMHEVERTGRKCDDGLYAQAEGAIEHYEMVDAARREDSGIEVPEAAMARERQRLAARREGGDA